MNQVVLVTGGSGFIGAWVLRALLNRGERAIVLDAQSGRERWSQLLGDRAGEIKHVDASLLDRDQVQAAIEQHGVTRVIHLAALLTPACQQDPWLGCQVNILGSAAVFDAARRAGSVRGLSYASSYAVYGPEAGDRAEELNRPPSFYGAFKQSVDLIAEQYWRHFELASVAVRPHVVYGPLREIGLTAAPSLACRAAALGERYTIGYTGRVGYDYVEDVAQAFVRAALECPPGSQVVDLPGEVATSEEFAQAIEVAAPDAVGQIDVSGPSIPMNVPPRPRYIAELFPKWQATSLAEGVRRTIEFYRAGNGEV